MPESSEEPRTSPVGASRPPGSSLLRRVWRSMAPETLHPATDRDRARITRFTFVLHLRPVRVSARTLRWTHTFGLGGSGLVLIVLLAASGILQMLVYQPVPGGAYESVVELERDVLFGSLIRGVHYWSANLLVVVVLLHAARVFLTGGFSGRRQFNWVLGSVLLASVLAAAFTGYLLPWDQLSFWAVTVSTGMLSYVPAIGSTLQRVVRGGAEVGSGTLTLFYTLHTTIVPVALVVFMAWHFWRVRRAGGVVVPPEPGHEPLHETVRSPDQKPAHQKDDDRKVMFFPDLLVREVSQALILAAAVFVLAAVFGAPLGDRANPGMSPNPTKAPWYFVGFQELLMHLHPTFAVLVVPLLAGAGLLLLPYLVAEGEWGGAWFLSRSGRRTALLASLAAVVVTVLLVVLDERRAGGAVGWLAGGLLPLVLAVLFVVGFAILARRGFDATMPECVQAVVVMLAVSFATLTTIGVWFRGPGMALVWPWSG